ncbi:MAG: OmpA family protein [Candidatus Eisenbacteria bacterium]|nr:OmpA family protein [Candidatus Eisenbacteria bacterium]
MACWKRLLSCAALGALFALPAQAQIGGRPIEAHAGAGISSFDARDFIKDSPIYTGSLGWRWMNHLSLEGSFTGVKTRLDRPGDIEHEWSYAALDARWNLRDPGERATPYLLTGFGLGRSLNAIEGVHRMGTPSIGAGFLYDALGSSRTYLRLQVRDILFREKGALESSHHLAVTAGLQFTLGGRPKDQDLDGVRNWLDKCPDTPIGAKVDASGCPLDSDKDGVYDGLDKCEGTPAGCKVGKDGCIVDTDGDGVCDGLDQCEATPQGAKVDAKGCPLDSDGDGVFDGLDRCENTPKGCQVDSTGCVVDTDKDGVCDGLDQCPNTPADLKVDPNGCPIEVSERETELLDTGTISLQDVNFDVGKATIKAESDSVLSDLARILLQYPTLTIEIGGHTDNSGSLAKNMTLSDARAKAVLAWLTSRYPALDASKYTVKGYGPTQPVASNSTALGRAKNRRVEFKVTNTEALKIEREKRGFLKKDGSQP